MRQLSSDAADFIQLVTLSTLAQDQPATITIWLATPCGGGRAQVPVAMDTVDYHIVVILPPLDIRLLQAGPFQPLNNRSHARSELHSSLISIYILGTGSSIR